MGIAPPPPPRWLGCSQLLQLNNIVHLNYAPHPSIAVEYFCAPKLCPALQPVSITAMWNIEARANSRLGGTNDQNMHQNKLTYQEHNF